MLREEAVRPGPGRSPEEHLHGVAGVALTEAQAGLWYAQQMDPANPVFNVAHAVELRGAIDLAALRSAVTQALAEAQSLALCIRSTTDGPRQHLDPTRRPGLDTIDLTGRPDPRADALAAMQAERMTPCDPARQPLAASRLYLLGPEHAIWHLRVHHLATDGYGMDLLAERAARLYGAARHGTPQSRPLAPLAAVIDEDRAYRQSAQRRDDAAFWRTTFTPLPAMPVPNIPAVSSHTVHRIDRRLPEAAAVQLQAFARAHQLPWTAVLTTLVALYLQRMGAGEDLVIGVPHMNRLGRAGAGVPAMVMNVLPVAVALDEDQPLAALCGAFAQRLAEAGRHGTYRSEQLRRDLGLLGGNKRLYGPLVNILPFARSPRFADLDTRIHVLATGPVDDLTLTFRGDLRHGLSLEVEANPALHTATQAAAHATRLGEFLSGVLAAGSSLPVPLASHAELEQLNQHNATQHTLPDTSLTALIERNLAAHPDAPAVVFDGQTLTYAELDRRSAALAACLVQRGVGANDFVAIALERSLELIVALVAVLRAGAACQPLDPSHPPRRLAALVEQTGAACLLVDARHPTLFVDDPRRLATPDWPTAPVPFERPDIAPSAAAYVIFTSGSTGTPKGVVVEHRAIVNRLLWMRDHYGFTAADRIAHKTPTTFDVSVWELFLPFITGATMVVARPDDHRDPRALVRLIRAERVTCMHFVPSMLATFLATTDLENLTLTRVFCSGEALDAELRDRFHQRIDAELHNLYGPTEAAVDVSWWPAGRNDHSQPLPIGFPVWNTRLYVLDARDRPLPPGVSGHLCIAGVQLARGYLGRPELTARTFVADPLVPGERMYRSGDLAYRRDDGAIVYLGRADAQIKIHGVRIEPGEIEAAILASGRADRACVLVREDRPGDQRLVAYVVPTAGYDEETMRNELRSRLPDYMQPAAWVALEAWPLTDNGKLDRKALPAPGLPAAVAGRPPQGATETQIAALFQELLGLPAAPDAEADFFALGGDSLLAVQLLLAVEQKTGVQLGLAALFAHPSVAALAAACDAGKSHDQGLSPLIRIAAGDARQPPLFLVHPAGGLAWCYLHLARALAPARASYGLQAPALDATVPLAASIVALATDYLQRLQRQQPQGPYYLAGWSMGGIIAHEIAVQLRRQGQPVALLAVLDAYPSDCWRAQPAPDPAAALRALLAIAGHDPDRYRHLDTRDAIIDFLRGNGSPLASLPAATLDGVVRVVAGTNRLVREHEHGHFDGPLVHVRAALDHADGVLTPQAWAPYVDGIDVIDLPCRHAELPSEAVSRRLAPLLAARLPEATPGKREASDATDRI